MGDNFINELSASLQKQSVDEYIKNHEIGLKRVDELRDIAEALKVDTIADYKAGIAIKSLLSSLFCYAFNNSKDYKQVGKIESIVGDKLYRFARTYDRIKDNKTRAVAKYLITNWRYYYVNEDIEKMVGELLSKNKLFEDKEGTYLVTGLHYSVGDNTFSSDRRGNWYRNYIKSCAIQAFYIKSRYQRYIVEHLRDKFSIPKLNEDIYTKVGVGDGKYLARVYLTEREHQIIRKYFTK